MLPSFHELSLQQLSIGPHGERFALSNQRRRNSQRRSFYTTRAWARDNICTICQEQLGDGTQKRELTCNHQFHEACISSWLLRSATCPLCNASVTRTEEEEAAAEVLAEEEQAQVVIQALREWDAASAPERFLMAADAVRIDIMTQLLASEDIPSETVAQALLDASREGVVGVVGLIVASRTMTPEVIGPALEAASLDGHAAVVRILVMTGQILVSSIETSLKGASAHGHDEVVRRLLSARSAISQRTLHESLHKAVLGNHTGVVTLILQTNLTSLKANYNLMMVAVILEYNDVLRSFIDNVSFRHARLSIPLVWAAKKGNGGAVRILLGINGLYIKGVIEAQAEATDSGHTEIVALLEAYAASSSVNRGDEEERPPHE